MNLTQRHHITKLYREGRGLSEIADKYNTRYHENVSVHNVYSVVRKDRQRSEERERTDKSTLRADELGKIDRLETEYWDAWFRSLKRASLHDTERVVKDDTTDDDTRDDIDLDDEDTPQHDNTPSPWDKWQGIDKEPRQFYHNGRNNGRGRFTTPHPYTPRDDTPPSPKITLTRKIVESCGDVKFLTGVQWCIDRRAKLLGLDAPTRAVTAHANIGAMRQMAREFAIAEGLDPDLIIDDVVASAEKMLQNMYQENV